MSGREFHMIATTFYGLEEVLAGELKALGAKNVKQANRAVSFVGDKGFMYKANLALATALRILMPVGTFRINNERDLYAGVRNIDWDNYLYYKDTFSVQSVVYSRHVSSHSHYIALKTKDAIVDFFKDRYGTRPGVDTKNPTMRVHVHISGRQCTVSLDSSGEPLFKRGYRKASHPATLNEVLAAGILRLAGYKGYRRFVDPMCGSGTLPIEAAFLATRIPPGIHRSFAFAKWEDFDEDLFRLVRDSLMNRIVEPKAAIEAYDISPRWIRAARTNVEAAGLSDFITTEEKDFFAMENPEKLDQLLLVSNPPYGERIGSDIENFYKRIGDTLKERFAGTSSWWLTPGLSGVKNIGLRPGTKIKLYNGSIECRLLNYEIYKGSKKKHKNNAY